MGDLFRRARLSFWLWVLDVIVIFGGLGSRAYGWAIERASNATDWGECADYSCGTGEEPF